MSIQTNQQLIDNKEWGELIQSDFICDFYKTSYLNYTPTKELALEFFWKKGILKRMIETARNKNMIFSTVPMTVISRFNKLLQMANIEIGIDGWKQYIDFLSNDFKQSDVTGFNMSFVDKDSDYIRLLIRDRGYYNKAINCFDSDRTSKNTITNELIDSLSSEEKKSLPKILSFDGKLGFDASPENLMLEIFDTPKDAVVYCVSSNKSKVNIGKMLSKMSEEDFISILKIFGSYNNFPNNISPSSIDYEFSKALSYFRLNRDASVPDSLLKDVFSINENAKTDSLFNIINNLSNDQIKNNIDNIHLFVLARSDKLSLDEIRKLKPGQYTTVQSLKGYVEEEIENNPKFFNPSRLHGSPSQYISEKTWKIINKANGTNFDYNENLKNFRIILMNIEFENITLEYIKYLKNKCEISNKEFLSWLNEDTPLNTNSNGMNKLNELKTFCEKWNIQ